jgi:hypothetical protein
VLAANLSRVESLEPGAMRVLTVEAWRKLARWVDEVVRS